MKCIVIVDSPEVKEERGKVSRNVRHRQGREAPQSHEIDFSRSHTWYNPQGLPYVLKDGGSQDGFRHLFNV